jgi:hypothetical protein
MVLMAREDDLAPSGTLNPLCLTASTSDRALGLSKKHPLVCASAKEGPIGACTTLHRRECGHEAP